MQIRVMAASSSLLRRLWYRSELESRGCDVETAIDESTCIAKVGEFQPNVLILESSLPGDGIDEVFAARERDSGLRSVPIIVIDDRHNAAQTYRLGAYPLAGYWRSPPTADELILAIRLALGRVDTLQSQTAVVGNRSP